MLSVVDIDPTRDCTLPLHAAVWRNDEMRVRELLLHEAGAAAAREYAHARTPEQGVTALHIAAHGGLSNLVPLLLVGGADVNACLHNGATPLHAAARAGHVAVCTQLLDAGASMRAVYGARRLTPLATAVACGADECVALLCARGADVGARDACDMPLLTWAAIHASPRIVDTLCGGAHIGKSGGRTCLEEGCGRLALTPLDYAAGRGRADVVAVLLAHGACVTRPNAAGFTPLTAAARSGHAGVVDVLLTHNGAHERNTTTLPPPCDGGVRHPPLPAVHSIRCTTCAAALLAAVVTEWRHASVARTLLLHGVRCSSEPASAAALAAVAPPRPTLLHVAAMCGDADMVRALLEAGGSEFDVEARMHVSGCDALPPLSTPPPPPPPPPSTLMQSISSGLSTLWNVGLTWGSAMLHRVGLASDPTVAVVRRQMHGGTPLFLAVCGQHASCVDVLLAHGACPVTPNSNGVTPLHAGASARAPDASSVAHTILTALLAAVAATRADVNVRCSQLVTPLHLAACVGNEAGVVALLGAGADVGARDACGQRAMDIAYARGYESIVSRLSFATIARALDEHGDDAFVECTPTPPTHVDSHSSSTRRGEE